MFSILSDRWKLKVACLLFIAAVAAPAASYARPPDLTIFFSSDTRGLLRRCGCSEGQMGGLSARSAYIKSNWVAGKTLVLDAGDTFFDGLDVLAGMPDFYSLKSRAILESMRQAGYTAAAVGEYDLALGTEFLGRLSASGGIPFLSANIKAAGSNRNIFSPGIIKSVGGVRVAVTAVLDDEFPYGSFNSRFKETTVTDPAFAARAFLGKNGRAGTLNIILAHLSVKDLHKFSHSVPEADIIIEGHSQDVLEKPEKEGNTIIVKGFYRGKQIGRLDLWLNLDRHGKLRLKKISDFRYRLIGLDESLPPDPEVERIIAGYRENLKARDYRPACAEQEGAGLYTGASRCRACHEKAYVNWSSTAHARAFATLVRTGDQYDPECLSCHTTGYGFKSGYRCGKEGMKNVACEDCHGRGSSHAEAMAKGGLDTGAMKREVVEKVCLGCHDNYNSPNFEYNKYMEMGGAHRDTSPVKR